MSNAPHVLITGDSEGLGNALMRSILRKYRDVRVIGLSRRPDERVEGWNVMPSDARRRYQRIRVDLADGNAVDHCLDEVVHRLATGSGKLVSVVLANGTGFLDSEAREDASLQRLMENLNLRTPARIAGRLANETQAVDPGARLLYYSGLVTHPSVTDPLLTEHAALKSAAVQTLRTRWPGAFTSVMPGAYRTAMLESTIRKPDALLEWYALPIADPYARGGLSDVVARIAVGRTREGPPQVIRPRIHKLLVENNTAESMMKTLPGAIARCARAVLAQTGQTDADHDARVRHMKEQQLYGPDFPYDDILSPRLWPRWASVAYARALIASGLGR